MPKPVKTERAKKYVIPFSINQIEELESLTMGLFDLTIDRRGEVSLPRMKWLALAYMAIGKADQIKKGKYDWLNGADDGVDTDEWVEDLAAISDAILFNFKPGDGRY